VAELTVRDATDEDIERVEVLVTDALDRAHSLRGGGALLETLGMGPGLTATTLARAICAPSTGGLVGCVAVLDDALVGVAVAATEASCLTLVGIHVARSLRRRQIGTALLTAVQDRAEAAGTRLEAVALPGDQTLKSLLEAAGYRARLLRLSVER